MKLLLTKDGNAVTIDASPHSFRLEAITTALLNLGVEAAYSLAIIELDQHGPFVRASCRLFRLHDGVATAV